MENAKPLLHDLLNTKDIRDPKFPILSFVDLKLMKSKEELKYSFVEGLTETVDFEHCVQKATELGI